MIRVEVQAAECDQDVGAGRIQLRGLLQFAERNLPLLVRAQRDAPVRGGQQPRGALHAGCTTVHIERRPQQHSQHENEDLQPRPHAALLSQRAR